jgi:virulence-associated protein VagC
MFGPISITASRSERAIILEPLKQKNALWFGEDDGIAETPVQFNAHDAALLQIAESRGAPISYQCRNRPHSISLRRRTSVGLVGIVTQRMTKDLLRRLNVFYNNRGDILDLLPPFTVRRMVITYGLLTPTAEATDR